MSRVVQVAAEQVRVPVALARVERVALAALRAERVRDALVSITFVTERRIASLNWEHLQHRGPTDVISFGFAPVAGANEVTGDKTQIDLPKREESGLMQVERILPGIDGIAFHYFTDVDVVRHRLVRDIIKAYAEDGD